MSIDAAQELHFYPVTPDRWNEISPDLFAFTGLMSSFLKAGFEEVERRSETRPKLRYSIET